MFIISHVRLSSSAVSLIFEVYVLPHLQRAKMTDFDRYKVMKAKRMVSDSPAFPFNSKS